MLAAWRSTLGRPLLRLRLPSRFRIDFFHSPVGPLGFLPLRYSEQHVKGCGSSRAHSGLSVSPGLSRIAQDLKKGFVVFFVVGQYALRIGDEQDIALGWQPFQIGQTFLQGVPVMAEVIGELDRREWGRAARRPFTCCSLYRSGRKPSGPTGG